jgi:hypothetical protein
MPSEIKEALFNVEGRLLDDDEVCMIEATMALGV